jgi:hypothetical protein
MTTTTEGTPPTEADLVELIEAETPEPQGFQWGGSPWGAAGQAEPSPTARAAAELWEGAGPSLLAVKRAYGAQCTLRALKVLLRGPDDRRHWQTGRRPVKVVPGQGKPPKAGWGKPPKADGPESA